MIIAVTAGRSDAVKLELIVGMAVCAVLTVVIVIPVLGFTPLLIVVGLLWLIAILR